VHNRCGTKMRLQLLQSDDDTMPPVAWAMPHFNKEGKSDGSQLQHCGQHLQKDDPREIDRRREHI
jgi:hypothetical protein